MEENFTPETVLQENETAENTNFELAGEETFETLIEGKYKEDFSKKVQSILDKRFKKSGKLFEIADKLKNEYGIENEEGLLERIKNGSNFKESPDDFKVWKTQSEKLKEIYTDFDLNTECKDPMFVSLLKSGADMKSAYEFMHREEILNEAISFAARKTKESVLSDIKARSMRPSENGISKRSAAIMKTDVRSLTRKEREDVSRRVLRGEKIKF